MTFLRTLQKFCRSLLGIKKQDQTNAKSSTFVVDHTHSVSIILHSDSLLVDVVLLHPDLLHLSNDELYYEAEKFAELLVYIANDLWEPRILTALHRNKDNAENEKAILFYDNIISLHKAIKKEFNASFYKNGPVIRPRLAFSPR